MVHAHVPEVRCGLTLSSSAWVPQTVHARIMMSFCLPCTTWPVPPNDVASYRQSTVCYYVPGGGCPGSDEPGSRSSLTPFEFRSSSHLSVNTERPAPPKPGTAPSQVIDSNIPLRLSPSVAHTDHIVTAALPLSSLPTSSHLTAGPRRFHLEHNEPRPASRRILLLLASSSSFFEISCSRCARRVCSCVPDDFFF